MLGVRVLHRTAVGDAAKRVGKAVDSVSSTGQQIGQWSDDVQYLRQRLAGKSQGGDKQTAGGPALAVARRILCGTPERSP